MSHHFNIKLDQCSSPVMTSESHIVVGIAAACSTFAVLACMFVIPSLYNTINEIHDEVINGVNLFRVSG